MSCDTCRRRKGPHQRERVPLRPYNVGVYLGARRRGSRRFPLARVQADSGSTSWRPVAGEAPQAAQRRYLTCSESKLRVSSDSIPPRTRFPPRRPLHAAKHHLGVVSGARWTRTLSRLSRSPSRRPPPSTTSASCPVGLPQVSLSVALPRWPRASMSSVVSGSVAQRPTPQWWCCGLCAVRGARHDVRPR